MLTARTERALFDLVQRRGRDPADGLTRPQPPSRRHDGRATRERVVPAVYRSAPASFERAVSRSIGIGKTIVELLFDPISSSVCR